MEEAYLGFEYTESEALDEVQRELLRLGDSAASSAAPSQGRRCTVVSMLPFVSNVYFTSASSTSTTSNASAASGDMTGRQACCKFLYRCGARLGPVLAPVATTASPSVLSTLPEMPKLRTSAPAVTISLPYGLGTMNRKTFYVVDLDFSQHWLGIISKCLRESRPSAQFAAQVVQLTHSLAHLLTYLLTTHLLTTH